MTDKWKSAIDAPRNAWPLAIAATILCQCGRGGRIVVTGGRMDGEWVYDCEHQIEVTHFMVLPKPPTH